MMREQMVPLTEQQTELLLRLVDGISAEQLTWVKGYLAGVSAAVRNAETVPVIPAAATADAARITILYGSQTGHAAAVAEAAKSKAIAAGFKVDLYAMGDYKPARLKNEKLLLIAVSTQGEGEPPDEALELHEFITAAVLRGWKACTTRCWHSVTPAMRSSANAEKTSTKSLPRSARNHCVRASIATSISKRTPKHGCRTSSGS
jgi:sulfite reductase alpha subunit-like flavoprotein